ncbi:MAG: asparagine synthetase B [Candidatus Thorarchaeota archaeon]|nr:asparagine synthetase B [Candidatus Thorarchaeota archaeon]
MVGIICRISRFREDHQDLRLLLELLNHRGEFRYIREIDVAEFHPGHKTKFENITIGVKTNDTSEAINMKSGSLYVVDSLNHTDSIPSTFETLIGDVLPLENSVILRISNEGLTVARSSDGQCAMYVAEGEKSILLATEKKCLWRAGFYDIRPIEPNEIYHVPWNGDIWSSSIPRPNRNPWSGTQEEALGELEGYLRESMNTIRNRKCGVLFSGGVDSSLIATIAHEIAGEIILFSAGTPISGDAKQTEYAADLLGIERFYTELSQELVWNILPDVIYAAETCNRMDIEIAIPFFVSAGSAKEKGVELLLSGQGPDELFAGYAKHVRLFEAKGPRALEDQLVQEVSVTHEANISRDERVIAVHNLNAFFPYLDQRFSELALSIPADWKIRPNENPERKVLFRRLATRMGLPESIAHMPKKATQYSSGTTKLLTKSIISHAGLKEGLSKKEIEASCKEVLNEIGRLLGFPSDSRDTNESQYTLENTYKFMEKRGIIPQQ